jgi:hypothetical protein
MANKLTDIFLQGSRVGRPLKYKTPEELEERINDYFNEHITTLTVEETGQEATYFDGVTITGLALFLGFCNRASMYDYKDKTEFTNTIKKATAVIEMYYEKGLMSKYSTGSIFALKNHGWSDKVEQEITTKETPLTQEERAERIKALKQKL